MRQILTLGLIVFTCTVQFKLLQLPWGITLLTWEAKWPRLRGLTFKSRSEPRTVLVSGALPAFVCCLCLQMLEPFSCHVPGSLRVPSLCSPVCGPGHFVKDEGASRKRAILTSRDQGFQGHVSTHEAAALCSVLTLLNLALPLELPEGIASTLRRSGL